MIPSDGQAALDVVLQNNRHAGLCKRVVQQSELQLDKRATLAGIRAYLNLPLTNTTPLY